MSTNIANRVPWLGLGLLCLVGGAGAGVRAFAQEPPQVQGRPTQKCRLFALADVEKDRELNTDDRSTEVGQWVASREGEGWTLAGIDFEIGQKATGYPQAWQQVCMEKR